MTKKEAQFDFTFTNCIYSGISNMIDFEIKHGTQDKTEELQYIVERYCNEYLISGNYLKEKLEEYKKTIIKKNTVENYIDQNNNAYIEIIESSSGQWLDFNNKTIWEGMLQDIPEPLRKREISKVEINVCTGNEQLIVPVIINL